MLLAVPGMPPKSQLLIPSKFDRWVVRDEMSLRFHPNTPEQVFRETLRLLLHAQARIQFYLGDAINFAGEKYARGKYDAYLETCGVSYVSLKAYAWIARSVSPKFRRPDLGFYFHAAVAPFSPKEQKRLLDAAAKNQWSVVEFRKQIRGITPLVAKAPLVPEYGEALDFPGLRRAPINELGVVYLFGLMSRTLDFDVEAVHSAFPDCSAKRLIDRKRNRWKQVRIEFEYKSSNFLLHQHESKHCDLIVCWIHDWPDCPLEVIALKDEMQRLK